MKEKIKNVYRKKKDFADHNCSFRLPNEKRAFAYCSKCEMDTIISLYDEYGTTANILRQNIILSDAERYILEFYLRNKVEPILK